MKKVIFLFVFPFLLNAQVSSKKINVLFLGNSYTYVNNLPLLIHDLALRKGDSLVYDSNCQGGYSFYNHFNDATSISKIGAGSWDYVVLQAQSQEPSFPPSQVNTQTLPYAIKLDSVIKHYNPCATTVFYETWGRKFGDASNCTGYPPVCTYAGMQNRLRDSYKLFADTTHAIMAPVGEAFRNVVSTNTVLDLYQADQSHPSLEGSYLAAAVFYETLFQHSVLTSTYNPGISTATVPYLNQIAHQLVNDSSMVWNVTKYIPKAGFTYTAQGSSSFSFQAASSYALRKWYFGDGSTAVGYNPYHTYINPGTYTVSLLAYNYPDCKKDSVSRSVVVSPATGIKTQQLQEISLYPNPCAAFLNIYAAAIFENSGSIMELRNVLGEVLERSAFTGVLNTSHLKNGLYYVKIFNSMAESNSCFIKNE